MAIVSFLTAWAKTDDVEMATRKTPPIIRAKTVCSCLECMGGYLGCGFWEKENTGFSQVLSISRTAPVLRCITVRSLF
jgi:hypothetical protein